MRKTVSPDPPVPGVHAGHPLVELEHATKRFGATLALDDVDLTVRAGVSHGLVGRNGAGKSTIVSLLTGVQGPDSGEIRLSGRPVARSDRRSGQADLACVFQHSMLLPNLSVAENLTLGARPYRHGRIDWRTVNEQAEQTLRSWGLDIDPRMPADALDVEQAQMVEIVRALSRGAPLIVLDEPTARLDAKAAGRLFTRIRDMQASGVTFLLISHYLHEVFEVCQEVTVLRDGRRVRTCPTTRTDPERLVADMVGDQNTAATAHPARRSRRAGTAGQATAGLSVRGLCGVGFSDFDLDTHAGEIVGIAGLASSGRSQIGEAIAGFGHCRGEVRVGGRPIRPGHVASALRHGVALVPRDRHRAGLVSGLSVEENLTLAARAMDKARTGLLPRKTIRRRADAMLRLLGIAPPRLDLPVSGLSGGNQQKVVLGRALATDPSVIVAVEPTSGVDIASKAALLQALQAQARADRIVIVCSDDLDDLHICDRVIVVRGGHIVDELPAGWDARKLVAAIEGASDDTAH